MIGRLRRYLPLPPDIWTKPPTRNCAAGGAVDRDGGRGTTLDVIKGAPDSRPSQARQMDQDGHLATAESRVGSSHHLHMVTNADTKSMGQRLVFFPGYRKGNDVNPNWPEQEVFCVRVRLFAERENLVTPRGGLDLQRLAERFDLAENTLKQFLQNKKRPRPHFNTLAVVASIIGCDVMEFVGETTATPVAEEDPESAAFGNVMGVLGKGLTPEMRRFMIEMAKSGQAIGLQRTKMEQEVEELRALIAEATALGVYPLRQSTPEEIKAHQEALKQPIQAAPPAPEPLEAKLKRLIQEKKSQG